MTGPQAVTMPPLVTKTGVELMALGTWELGTGTATFTPEDITSAIEAAQCPAVGAPPIKLGHFDPRFNPEATEGSGTPAFGRVVNMALTANQAKVTGDLAGMPGWLGAIQSSAFPQRSIEGAYDFVCQIGHVHPFVITGLALLGVTPPGVGVLQDAEDIAAAYGIEVSDVEAAGPVPARVGRTVIIHANAEGGPMPARKGGAPAAAATTTEDVRRAFYAQPGLPWSQWITEMQLAPNPQLIVADDSTAKVWRIPIMIDGSDVTFGDPVEVEVEYVDIAAASAAEKVAGIVVAAGLTGSVEVFASAAESRAGVSDVAAWSAATQEKNLGDDPPKSALAAMYALPGDTKSDSKLPHHTVDASTHEVGAADVKGCEAAIAAINGGRGGLKGESAADLKAAYTHCAKHIKDAGGEPAEYSGPSASAPAQAGGPHGPFTGTHSHPHSAMGGQGGDTAHDHPHDHDGDAGHAHVHAGAPLKEGGSAVDLTDEQTAALRASLGLAEDAELTPDALVKAAAKLKEQAETPVAAAKGGRLPDGVMVIDKGAWESLNERTQKLEAAAAQRRVKERDQVIADAVRAGKFNAGQMDRYRRIWDNDPEGTRELIASMTPNVVPVDDIGAATGGDDLERGGPGYDEYVGVFGDDARPKAGARS